MAGRRGAEATGRAQAAGHTPQLILALLKRFVPGRFKCVPGKECIKDVQAV